jgi:parvulin-like peptidyl-prolyl isomerase
MWTRKFLLPGLALALALAPASAQDGGGLPPLAPTTPTTTAPATGTAAKVNGQSIPEVAVQRGLRRVPAARQAEARPALLDFLIENALIDQYLAQLKVEVDKKDVEAHVQKIFEEIKKSNSKVEDVLKELLLTEAELRTQVEADLRWNKFVEGQATDENLRKFFEANHETFDGTQVRARHILITPSASDPKSAEEAVARLKQYKKEAEDAGTAAAKELPANADAFTKKRTYNDALEAAFAERARKNSVCGSAKAGGDLEYFERTHGMVEPFARAAFALKPYEMSDPVKTQFGYHLILVTDRRQGREVKFEDKDMKDRVKEVYGDRLREAVVAAMRPRAKIEITAAAKKGGE